VTARTHGWIVYHPRRVANTFDGIRVHCDHTGRNQDTYVWNERFTHSYCRITQMAPVEEDVILWVSGDRSLPDPPEVIGGRCVAIWI
jgi:hypothetical protein